MRRGEYWLVCPFKREILLREVSSLRILSSTRSCLGGRSCAVLDVFFGLVLDVSACVFNIPSSAFGVGFCWMSFWIQYLCCQRYIADSFASLLTE